MNLLQAEKAILHLVENSDSTRKELEDLAIYQVMEKLAEYMLGRFKGRFLAPMFAEDKKFQVTDVAFRDNRFYAINQDGLGLHGIVELDLDELLELDEAGQTETDLKDQYTVGFCK